MGNDLNRLSQVGAFAFLINNSLVNFACGHVAGPGGIDAQKTFVMSQIKVCFGSVFSYITFSVFIGIQCSGIYVNIRIKFLYSNAQASGL